MTEALPTNTGKSFTYLVDTSLPIAAANVGRWRLLRHGRGHRRSYGALSLTLPLVVTVRGGCRCEVAHGRQSRGIRPAGCLLIRCRSVSRFPSYVAEHNRIFSCILRCLLLCSVVSGRLREELLEVFEKIGRTTE